MLGKGIHGVIVGKAINILCAMGVIDNWKAYNQGESGFMRIQKFRFPEKTVSFSLKWRN